MRIRAAFFAEGYGARTRPVNPAEARQFRPNHDDPEIRYIGMSQFGEITSNRIGAAGLRVIMTSCRAENCRATPPTSVNA